MICIIVDEVEVVALTWSSAARRGVRKMTRGLSYSNFCPERSTGRAQSLSNNQEAAALYPKMPMYYKNLLIALLFGSTLFATGCGADKSSKALASSESPIGAISCFSGQRPLYDHLYYQKRMEEVAVWEKLDSEKETTRTDAALKEAARCLFQDLFWKQKSLLQDLSKVKKSYIGLKKKVNNKLPVSDKVEELDDSEDGSTLTSLTEDGEGGLEKFLDELEKLFASYFQHHPDTPL